MPVTTIRVPIPVEIQHRQRRLPRRRRKIALVAGTSRRRSQGKSRLLSTSLTADDQVVLAVVVQIGDRHACCNE